MPVVLHKHVKHNPHCSEIVLFQQQKTLLNTTIYAHYWICGCMMRFAKQPFQKFQGMFKEIPIPDPVIYLRSCEHLILVLLHCCRKSGEHHDWIGIPLVLLFHLSHACKNTICMNEFIIWCCVIHVVHDTCWISTSWFLLMNKNKLCIIHL